MIRAPRPQTIARISAPVVLGLLAAHLLLAHGRALTAPFFSDDFLFLDKVRGASLAQLLEPRDLAYHWYRPWSRELHFAAISSSCGVRPLPFHVANFALWLGVLALFFTLARRLAGARVTAIAAAGVAAQAGWGVPVEWGPGSQDLWMMLWSLGALHAYVARRTVLGLACLALALLSKESAAVLPGIAFALDLFGAGDPPSRAVRRVAPWALVVAAWAAWHPALGGRLWWASGEAPLPDVHSAIGPAAVRSLGSLANLDLPLAPASGWSASLAHGLLAALALGALAVLAARAEAEEIRAGRVAAFGVAWAVLGWLPVLAPSVIWQSYYPLWGSLGAWLAISAALDRMPRVTAALVLAVALIAAPRSDTPSEDWGSDWVHHRGKQFAASAERFVKDRVPSPPRNSRFYFSGVPSGAVFVLGPGDTPAPRVWYADRSIRGYYWSQYQVRAAGDSAAPDYFFRRDSLDRWTEVPPGQPPPAADLPRWMADHENLAVAFIQGGDLSRAGDEYESLAAAAPDEPSFAFMAGLCAEERGDRERAGRWFASAAKLPRASEEMKAKAREYGRGE